MDSEQGIVDILAAPSKDPWGCPPSGHMSAEVEARGAQLLPVPLLLPGWCLGAVPVKSRCDARGICDKTVCRAKQTQHWCVGLSQGKQCAGAGLLARAGTREPRSLTQRELRREVAADPRIQELISQRGHWKALAFWEMSPNAS